jgi:hypothetical protein
MGVNIREHHFSTERDVVDGASKAMKRIRIRALHLPVIAALYQVGHFQK